MRVSKSVTAGKLAVSISVCATLVGCNDFCRSAENSAALESSDDAALESNLAWGAGLTATGNVSLGSPYNIGSWGGWQDVVGDDTSTGFSFATPVFGNKFTIQLLSGGGT